MPETYAPQIPPESTDHTHSSNRTDLLASDTGIGTALPVHIRDEVLLNLPSDMSLGPDHDSPRVRTMSTSPSSNKQKSRRTKVPSQAISEAAADTIGSVRRSATSNHNVSTLSRAEESVNKIHRPRVSENITAHGKLQTWTSKNDISSTSSLRGLSGRIGSPSRSHAASTAYQQPTAESVGSSISSSKLSQQRLSVPVHETVPVAEESWAKHDDLDTAINEWRKAFSNNVSAAEAKKLLKKLAGTSESSIQSAQSTKSHGREAAAVPLPDSGPTSDSRESSRSSKTWHMLQSNYPMTASTQHRYRPRSSQTSSSYSWHAMQACYPFSPSSSKRSTPTKGADVEEENRSELSNRLNEAEVSRRTLDQIPSSSHKRIVEDEPYYAVIDGVGRRLVRYRLGSESGMT